MKTIQEKAYAKLNISLDVGKCREDGFHEMTMVMQSISLADAVTVTLNDSGKVRARTSLPFIPGDERNLAVKAALCFLEAIGRQPECKSAVTTTMLMGCAIAETTGLYALVIAILLIFVAPSNFINLLLNALK